MSSNIEPMKRGLTKWHIKGDNSTLSPILMESASLRNASDFEELRSEYMKLTLELRGSTIGSEPVLEAVKAPEGFKEKIAAVLKNIFSPEDFGNHWVPP